MISKALLRNPTPENRQRLLERADVVRRTRALEELIRAHHDAVCGDESLEPATIQSNGAEIAPHPTNA